MTQVDGIEITAFDGQAHGLNPRPSAAIVRRALWNTGLGTKDVLHDMLYKQTIRSVAAVHTFIPLDLTSMTGGVCAAWIRGRTEIRKCID